MADSDKGAVRRFSGEKPEEYRPWKKWARAWLNSKDVKEDARGSALLTLLSGAAFKAVQDVDDDQIEQPGGEDVIFAILDDRYPELPASDKLGDVMRTCLRLQTQKHEEASGYTARARAAFAEAEREGILLPEMARGLILLEGCRLDGDKEAGVMAAAQGSWR